jgi:hypothetical protein
MFDLVADCILDVGPQTVALFEVCNEIGGTGDDDDRNPRELERLCERVRRRLPQLLYSLSATAGASDERGPIAEYTLAWMRHYYYHPQRGGRFYDKLRHLFGLGYSGEHPAVRWLGWAGEPWGNGRLVSVTANKHELGAAEMAMGGAMAAMSRQAWCHMGGSSVVYNDDPLESPGFYETPALMRRLPRDLAQFRTLGHSGDRPNSPRIWKARGDCRSDYAIHDDGRFVAINYGPPEQDPHRLDQVRAASDIEIVQTSTFGRVLVGHL